MSPRSNDNNNQNHGKNNTQSNRVFCNGYRKQNVTEFDNIQCIVLKITEYFILVCFGYYDKCRKSK